MLLRSMVSMFIPRLVKDRRLPFTSTARDPIYSKANVAYLLNSYQQIKDGQFVEKTIEELEQMAK